MGQVGGLIGRDWQVQVLAGEVTRALDSHGGLVLEDLHWADAASLRLLAFVVQHTWFERLLVVATYRDAEVESLEPVLMPLVPKATTVQLTGLDEAGAAALTGRTTGATPDPAVVAEIHRCRRPGFATGILAVCTAFTKTKVDRLFTHDLVRETLYTSAESSIRARHAAVARAMGSVPMLPAERARHAYLAADDLARPSRP
jgi:hypothetical protein